MSDPKSMATAMVQETGIITEGRATEEMTVKVQSQQSEDSTKVVLPANVDTSKSETQVVVFKKLPRENGYGDFCLSRPLFVDHISRVGQRAINYDNAEDMFDYNCTENVAVPQKLWTEEEWVDNFGNNPIPELDGYERVGTFAYFSLPLEAREKILRYTLAPFFKFDSTTNLELLKLTIKRWAEPNISKKAFKKGLGYYFETMPDFYKENEMEDRLPVYIRSNSLDTWHFLLSPYKWKSSNTWFSKVKEGLSHEIKKHPSRPRHRQYTVDVDVTKQITRCTGDFKDWGSLELLRTLSNISSNFRQDVGQVLWKNTAISVQLDDKSDEDWDPRTFLAKRLAIHKGIKSLRIPYNECADDIENMSDMFRKFCRYLAKCPDIELSHLQVDIHSWGGLEDVLKVEEFDEEVDEDDQEYGEENDEHNDEEDGDEEDDEEYDLKLIRGIKVTGSFEITVEYHSGVGTSDNYFSGLHEKLPALLPRLRECLMPRTLKAILAAQVIVDEQEEYVQNRLS